MSLSMTRGQNDLRSLPTETIPRFHNITSRHCIISNGMLQDFGVPGGLKAGASKGVFGSPG